MARRPTAPGNASWVRRGLLPRLTGAQNDLPVAWPASATLGKGALAVSGRPLLLSQRVPYVRCQQCEMLAGQQAGELVTGPAGVSLRDMRAVRDIDVPSRCPPDESD